MIATCQALHRAGDFARSIAVGETALAEISALGLVGTEDAITLAATLVVTGPGETCSRPGASRSRRFEQAERLGSRRAQGNAYWSACTIAMSRGELTLALDLATRALALLSGSGESRSLATLRINYAWLLLRSDPPRLDAAEDQLAQAHVALSELAVAPLLAACETEMAWAALLRGEPQRAAEIASRAQARCTDRSAMEFQAARFVSGLAQVREGQIDAGARTCADAAAELAALGCRREAAQAWCHLADVLIEHGQSERAIQALRRAADK